MFRMIKDVIIHEGGLLISTPKALGYISYLKNDHFFAALASATDDAELLRGCALGEAFLDFLEERRRKNAVVEPVGLVARYGTKIRTRPDEAVHLGDNDP